MRVPADLVGAGSCGLPHSCCYVPSCRAAAAATAPTVASPDGDGCCRYFLAKAQLYAPDFAALRFSYGLNGILLPAADAAPLGRFLLVPRHTAYYLLLLTAYHCPPLAPCHYYYSLTTHYSLLTTHYSLLTTH